MGWSIATQKRKLTSRAASITQQDRLGRHPRNKTREAYGIIPVTSYTQYVQGGKCVAVGKRSPHPHPVKGSPSLLWSGPKIGF